MKKLLLILLFSNRALFGMALATSLLTNNTNDRFKRVQVMVPLFKQLVINAHKANKEYIEQEFVPLIKQNKISINPDEYFVHLTNKQADQLLQYVSLQDKIKQDRAIEKYPVIINTVPCDLMVKQGKLQAMLQEGDDGVISMLFTPSFDKDNALIEFDNLIKNEI